MAETIGEMSKQRVLRGEPTGLQEARIRRVDPDTLELWVTIDRESGTQLRGPCVYAFGADPGPQEGDRAWVQQADSGRRVVIAWWPA